MSKRHYFLLKGGSLGCHVLIKRRHRRKPVLGTKSKELAEKRAQALVENATDAELTLKRALDEKNVKYWFQSAVEHRGKIAIVDFAFPRANKETRLFVEIDGGYHLTDKQKDKDSARTKWLFEHTGAEILRFTNEDVATRLDHVVEKILNKRVQYVTAV